jgi:hypothetical protein
MGEEKGQLQGLLDELQDLLGDEDLEDEKLRKASEDLLPRLADALNGLSPCLLNAKKGEPLFVLRAQDLTASFTVELWAYFQLALRNLVKSGETPYRAWALVREHFVQAMTPQQPPGNKEEFTKIAGAYEICDHMKAWEPKKLAD